MAGAPIDRVSALWRIDGRMTSSAPLDPAEPIIHDIVRHSDLVIVVDSPVIPMHGSVRIYETLSDSGVPATDVPTSEITCALSDSPCRILPGVDSVEVIVDAAHLGRGVAVVELYYLAQGEQDLAEGVNHYAASWAFRPR